MGVAFVFGWFAAFVWLLSHATAYLCDVANARGLGLERTVEEEEWL
jgi:hypothetical protein